MKYTNNYDLPKSIFEALVKNTYDLSQTDISKISVTTLASPPRMRQLRVRHWNDLEEDAADNLWILMGSAIHEVLERVNPEDRMVEERLEEDVLGVTVSGKLDLYEKSTNTIQDYKFTSVWSAKQEDKKEWIAQINCYAWLLRKKGFEVDKAYINAILRDWRKTESLKYNDYPPIAYKKINIELWSLEEQQKYVEERVKIHQSVLELADVELPICSEEERWAKPDTFAVYKNKNKTASRVLNSNDEAVNWIDNATNEDIEKGKKNEYRIDERKGGDTRCQGYCSCCEFCDYWKENYGG